jgi:transcriptional regulator NrdR family protein
MKTLVASPFQDDAAEILEWAYGVDARVIFNNEINYGNQRAGQAFMNVLRSYDRESYERLTGSVYDPFYDDSRLGEAIDRLTRK